MESATLNQTIADLRRLAIAHSFFPPTTLKGALEGLRFVQADPIRAPARAQDLTLRHRVENYRAGDLERSYPRLGIAEDVFVNYGFMPASVQALMHPRSSGSSLPVPRGKRVRALLEFVREREAVHPREVDAHFQAGTVRNYWGGSSNATTHLLDRLHYLGHLRIARREEGIRIYAAQEPAPRPADAAARDARIDTLVGIAIRKYAPLPSASLSGLVRRLRYGVPQAKRRFGYYALPMLWRDRVIGWGNLAVEDGALHAKSACSTRDPCSQRVDFRRMMGAKRA